MGLLTAIGLTVAHINLRSLFCFFRSRSCILHVCSSYVAIMSFVVRMNRSQWERMASTTSWCSCLVMSDVISLVTMSLIGCLWQRWLKAQHFVSTVVLGMVCGACPT